jgi:predicted RNA methylase
VRDVPALFALMTGDDESTARAVGQALGRMGAPARAAVRAALSSPGTEPPLRARLVRWLGEALEDAAEVDALLPLFFALLADEDPKTRRHAALALGRVRGRPEVEEALLRAWPKETRVEHRRALSASLGKVGGPRALALLEGVETEDAELGRVVAQARLLLRRNLTRAEEGRLDVTARPPRPLRVRLHCRQGLEGLLAQGLGVSWGGEATAPGQVDARLAGPLTAPFGCRLMSEFGFPLAPEAMGAGEDVDAALVRALGSRAAEEIVGVWTRGPVRYRLAWEGEGQRRAAILRAVRRLAKVRPGWINDPSQRLWEVVATERAGAVAVELRPRLEDERFAYRVALVPAASHPPLAAALAEVGGVRAEDVVWDPFVGAGTELIERARRGRYRALLGTDLDAKAIEAARANLAAAGVEGRLWVGDACQEAPRGVTLIVTNPPMGRRVQRQADLGALLERFVDHAARVLVKGGRMVWVSPLGRRTAARARAAGLVLEFEQRVDMGGFWAEIQRFVRR